MSLIMTMSMEEYFITQCMIVPVTVNMVGFHHISIFKGQFTPPAFSLLFLQKFGLRLIQHGMPLQPLTPIQGISIIRACVSFHLDMPLDRRPIVLPNVSTFRCTEHLSVLYMVPIFLLYPLAAF